MISTKISSQAPRILIIEDEVGLLDVISFMLKHDGYSVITATSGEQGIELARQERPDLILCDIMMPVVDGYDVLKALQGQSATATIPFIFLTARARAEDFRTGMELGADDYLTKPVSSSVLLKAVRSRLDRYHSMQADKMAVFAQRLVLSQEHERQQLASVLDNEINQSLRSLQFVLNMQETPDDSHDPSLLKGAQDLLQTLIQRVEGIAQEIHPTILEQLGLLPAVRWLTEQYQLDIELEIENLDYKFDHRIGVCAFRLIQESLDNVVNHAETTAVKLSLKYVDSYLEIRVEDTGKGFDLEKALQSGQNVGLQHMHELAIWGNGELRIASEPKRGTTVHVLLPQTAEVPTMRTSVAQDFLRRASHAQQLKNPTITTVKTLLAMEQPLQRQGMRRLLKNNSQIQVIADVPKLDMVIEAIKTHNPELLIITPIAENKSQTEILQGILEAHPETAILVISAATHDEYVQAAFESGAMGFIPNTATITDLHTAIMRVAKKQYHLSPTLTFDLESWQESKPWQQANTQSKAL